MTTTNWIAVGASVAGTSHAASNKPCQDAHKSAIFGCNAEYFALVVADGAGSASYSEVGARLACEELLSLVTNNSGPLLFEKEQVEAWISETRARVLAESDLLGVSPRELASTIILAVLGPSAAVYAQIGDGCIVIRHGDDYSAVFWPDVQEYANATDFLTDERYLESLRFVRTDEVVQEVAVFSDGLQRLALDFANYQPFAAFFRPLFTHLSASEDVKQLQADLVAFLDSPRINNRTDDDKTLIIATRKP